MIEKETLARIHHGYEYHVKNHVGLFTLPLFSEIEGLDHGFTARYGGVSKGSLSSLNLSFSRPEPRENILRNYQIFCSAADIPYEQMVMNRYEHGIQIETVTSADWGRGYLREPLAPCDGLVTNDPQVTLVTGHADCMALYFCDPVKKCLGMAHAGWRGALHGMAAHMVRALCERFGSDPTHIYAGIGPCICGDCYEVDQELGEQFSQQYGEVDCVKPGKPGKAYVDIALVAICQLLRSGIVPEHIMTMDVCTFEDDRLYSYRRDRGDTGGMAAYVRWK